VLATHSTDNGVRSTIRATMDAAPRLERMVLVSRRIVREALALGTHASRVSATLLQRVAEGDMAAVRHCIEQYRGLVWSLARQHLQNAAEAEDAVQEIFIDIWKSAGRFDPAIASEPAFIAMISRRRLIDRRRRNSKRLDAAASVPIEEIDVDSGQSVGPGVEIAEEASLANDAMRTLKPEQQRVLRLAVCDGWSHQQIADRLRMPLGTVKTHVRRGLIRVRELLDSENPDGAGRDAT